MGQHQLKWNGFFSSLSINSTCNPLSKISCHTMYCLPSEATSWSRLGRGEGGDHDVLIEVLMLRVITLSVCSWVLANFSCCCILLQLSLIISSTISQPYSQVIGTSSTRLTSYQGHSLNWKSFLFWECLGMRLVLDCFQCAIWRCNTWKMSND